MLLMPAVLPAHNTLFGDAPRTIWKNGIEVEAETEWEIFRRTVHEDSTLSNPKDTRVQMWTYKFALTYGFTKDISMRLGVPIGYAIRRSKDTNLNDHYWGLRDMNLGFKFRLYNEPHPGGSFQGGLFIDFKLPTAQRRDGLGAAYGVDLADSQLPGHAKYQRVRQAVRTRWTGQGDSGHTGDQGRYCRHDQCAEEWRLPPGNVATHAGQRPHQPGGAPAAAARGRWRRRRR